MNGKKRLRKEPYILVPEKFETSLSRTKDLKITLKRKLDTAHSNKGDKKKPVGERDDYVPSSKKKKKIPIKRREQDSSNDFYCWICHREGSVICCELCPRVYHSRCLQLNEETDGDWFCPECQKIMKAECVETQSRAMSMLSVDQLSRLLIFSLQRMKHSWAQPFLKPVDLETVPEYYEYIFHPMDLSTLEKNIKSKKYGSTDAFIAEAKWILHNCIVYNGSNHKLTNNAKMIIKICKHEMSEIEICEDCYLSSCIKRENWFCEPCREPHPLVWARLQGFPFWPAKALQTKKGQVDVRFFGQHDRAWVPVANCYMISEEIPITTKKKTNGLNNAITEMGVHIEKICKKFGKFDYAPYRTPYDPKNTNWKKPINTPAAMKKSRNKISIFQKSPVISIKKEPLDASGEHILVEDKSRLCLLTNETVKPNDNEDSKNIEKNTDTREPKGTGKSNNNVEPKDTGKPNDTEKATDTRKPNITEKVKDASVESSNKCDSISDENADTCTSIDVNRTREPEPTAAKEVSSNDKQGIDKGKNKTEEMEDNKSSNIEAGPEASNEISKTVDNTGSVSEESTDIPSATTPGVFEVCDVSLEMDVEKVEDQSATKLLGKEKMSPRPKPLIEKLDEKKLEKCTGNITEESLDKMIDGDSIDVQKETKIEGKDIKETSEINEKNDNHGNTNQEKHDEKRTNEMDTSTDGQKPISSRDNEANLEKEDMEGSNKKDEKKGEMTLQQGLPKRDTFMEKLGKTIESCKALLGLKSELEDKEADTQSESESEESESDSESSDEDIEEIGYEVRRKRSCSSEEAMDVDDNSTEQSGKISPVPDEDDVTNDEQRKSPSIESDVCMNNDKESEEDMMKPESKMADETSGITFQVNENTTKVQPVNLGNASQPTVPDQNGMDAIIDLSGVNNEIDRKSDFVNVKEDSDKITKEDDKMEINEKESKIHQENSSKVELIKKEPDTPKDLKIELNECKNEGKLENDEVLDHVKEIVDLVQKQTPGVQLENGALPSKKHDLDESSASSKNIADDGKKQQSSGEHNKTENYGKVAARIKNFDKYIGKVSNVVKEALIEMYSEVAEESVEDETKKVMKGFQDEVEFLKWRHTRELEEFKHVAALTIAEMRSTFDHDKAMALETLKKQMEAEKQTAIDLTKKKQWCANCEKEAVFYCCWNTSYCDYPCQQKHWPAHMKTCQQLGTTENTDKTPKSSVTIQSPIMKPTVSHSHVLDTTVQNNPQLGNRARPMQIIPAVPSSANKLQTLIQYVQAPHGANLQTTQIRGGNPRLAAPNPAGLYRLEPVQQIPVLRPQNNIIRNVVGNRGQPVILRPNTIHQLPSLNQRL
ncbi:protein kinase C-binding protein 1-like isoform X2 [Anneissia japonica]|uniref:protein kinase C-binding protein 1-like isoform X2 n=1 Tax=Anneissia japonica TaxID=1529436 RepID=UPI0014257B62|nr:protein kinase C-binding protein 1-like isoform X2 [Anneissia japonica]